MAKEKFSWKGYLAGLKSLLARNPILIIIIYSLNQYGNNMKNGFRTLVATKMLGLSPTVVGFALSVFLITGLVFRTPAGAITDTLRSKLKPIIVVSFVLKGLIWIGFNFITNTVGYYILFFLDGVIWSFTGTMLPALMAISIDRRAMGSGYALMMGICNIVSASARSVGISLFNEKGLMTATLVAAATGILTALVACCLDTKKVAGTPAPGAGAPKPKKKGILAGISVSMIPFCIVAAMPIVLFNAESNFSQMYFNELGFDFLTPTTIGGTIYGVLSIAIGILCDIMNPAILITIGLLGQVVAPIMWADSASPALMSAGLIIYYSTRYYGTAFRVLGMKAVSRSEQGAMSATMLLFNDIFSVACTSIIGVVVTAIGYEKMFLSLAVWCGISTVGFVILNNTFLKKLNAQRAAEAE